MGNKPSPEMVPSQCYLSESEADHGTLLLSELDESEQGDMKQHEVIDDYTSETDSTLKPSPPLPLPLLHHAISSRQPLQFRTLTMITPIPPLLIPSIPIPQRDPGSETDDEISDDDFNLMEEVP